MSNSNWYLGIDGCPSGWICVAINKTNNWEINTFSSISDIWENYNKSAVILIDIPIGLRDNGPLARLCDTEARSLLTRKRSSSVFPTPCRSVLSVNTYEEANAINRQYTNKGLSKQAWNITAKIKDVDQFLQENENLRDIIIESHPELCFMAFANGNPLEYYKKKKEGIQERKDLLRSYFNETDALLNEASEKFDRNDVVVDDVLDALVLALSASVGIEKIKFIPEDFEYDLVGLPMRMAIPQF